MTDTFTGRDKQSGLPPDAIFLDAIQAAHLTKIHIDIISTQLAAGRHLVRGTWPPRTNTEDVQSSADRETT
jgi:hypothetical protein